MKILSLLTTISVAIFTLPPLQHTSAQSRKINKASHQSKNKPRDANQYDERARMGMYYTVMCVFSEADGRTAQARAYAEKAVSLLENPSDDFEFYAKGIAYMALENDDLALVNFDKAIKYNPENSIAYIGRGRIYSNKGDHDRALADFDKAIQLKSKESTAVEQSSDKRGNDGQASDVHQWIQRDPRPWLDYSRPGDAYRARGKAYISKGDYDRAITDFTKAIQLDPTSANNYSDRGTAYGRNGDLDRAIADFDRAIQLNPQLKIAYYNRGVAFEKKGEEARARADFETEEKLSPKDTSVPDNQKIPAPTANADGELVTDSALHLLHGRAITLVKPQYPAIARQGHAAGLVEVKVLVDEQGNVVNAQAISGNPLLWAVSVEAAKKSLFSPTLIAGRPIKVTGVIQYRFIGKGGSGVVPAAPAKQDDKLPGAYMIAPKLRLPPLAS